MFKAPSFRSKCEEHIQRMMDLIKKIVGTKNDREIKRIRPYVDEINNLEPNYQRLTRRRAQGKNRSVQESHQPKRPTSFAEELEEAQTGAQRGAEPEERDELKSRVDELDKELRRKRGGGFGGAVAGGVRRGARGFAAHHWATPFRRPVDRRRGAARRQDRRNENRRRQDLGRDLGALSKRAHRARRALDHRQRLPGAPRRAVDGADLSQAGPDRGVHRA